MRPTMPAETRSSSSTWRGNVWCSLRAMKRTETRCSMSNRSRSSEVGCKAAAEAGCKWRVSASEVDVVDIGGLLRSSALPHDECANTGQKEQQGCRSRVAFLSDLQDLDEKPQRNRT